MCVAVNFINKVGSPFKLYSSLKHEGYLVIGPSFKLKLIINRPELHSQVTFYAEDLSRKQRILLNERLSISKPVVADCPQFEDVFVTAERGMIKRRYFGDFTYNNIYKQLIFFVPNAIRRLMSGVKKV